MILRVLAGWFVFLPTKMVFQKVKEEAVQPGGRIEGDPSGLDDIGFITGMNSKKRPMG